MTITTDDYRRIRDEAEAEDAAKRAERDRLADEERQQQQERAVAETNAKIDQLKASIPPVSTVVAKLQRIRGDTPPLADAIAQRNHAVTNGICAAHGIQSERVQRGPNGSWVVIDGQRISTQRAEIGTEVARVAADLFKAAGEAHLEAECRARIRGGNALQEMRNV